MTDAKGTRIEGPTIDQGALAVKVRDAVLAVPGVVRLTPGTAVEVATQYAGGKIFGVRLGDPVQVHVAVDWVPIAPLAERIRDTVRNILRGVGQSALVEVIIDDIEPVLAEKATEKAGR